MTVSTISTTTDFSIMNIKDFEDACRTPVGVLNVATYVILIPIHVAGVFACFSHFAQKFNPNQIQADMRHRMRLRSLYS